MNKMKVAPRGRERGMSLLETLCTITIMGSLSASALPRLVDLPADARKSVLMGLEGALRSTSALTHAKCAAQSGCDLYASASQVVLAEGAVHMVRGYPQGGDAAGIESALQLSGFTLVHAADTTVFRKTGAPNEAACSVSYASPPAEGAAPSITMQTAGC